MNDNTKAKATAGEELFLVHLKRQEQCEDDEEDHDYPTPRLRKPKHSIGEELFSIHQKRLRGLEPDYDLDKDIKISSSPNYGKVTSSSASNIIDNKDHHFQKKLSDTLQGVKAN